MLKPVWHSFKPWLFLILTILTLSQAINLNFSHIQSLYLFLKPHLFTDRPLFLILSLLFLCSFVVHLRQRGIPLSIVSSDIKVFFETPTGDRVRVTREQKVRANHPGVTGYFRDVTVDKGSIPKNLINAHIDYLHEPQQHLHFEGTDRALSIAHLFDEPIPRHKWLPFNFKKVGYSDSLIMLDAFTDDKESFSVKIARYPHTKLTLTIFFHRDRPPDFPRCRALRINATGVTDEHLRRLPPGSDGREGIQLQIKRSRSDRFKIMWEYEVSQHRNSQS